MKEAKKYAEAFISDSLGDNVRLYTILDQIFRKFLDSRASQVMDEKYFDRANGCVRGLKMKAYAITGHNLRDRFRADGSPVLRDIHLPPMLFTVLNKCLEIRDEVGAGYETKFASTGNPDVDESNKRHHHYRETLRYVREHLLNYKEEVDTRTAAAAAAPNLPHV